MGKFAASIVIPTFNRAGRVGRAIESAISQTVPCEIIVVDHGSSDQTAEVVASFGSRIKYIRREFDSGPVFAWLDGIHASSCNFVKLLFDDDWLEPEFVQITLGYFNKDVGFVFSAASRVTEASLKSTVMFRGRFPESGVFSGRTNRRKVGPKLISPTALIMRRKDMIDGLIPGLLPFQTSTSHGVGPDHFVKLNAMLRYPAFGYTNRPLANFLDHPGSTFSHAVKDRTTRHALGAAYAETYAYFRFVELSRRLGIWRLTALYSRLEQVLAIVKKHISPRIEGLNPLGVRFTRVIFGARRQAEQEHNAGGIQCDLRDT